VKLYEEIKKYFSFMRHGGCEMLRISHCLDNRLIDGGKVVSPTHRPLFTPQKYYFNVSGTHFC
jgi:hypothetical protein